ncbi:MAG TPA: TIGR03435 family protein [Candidatus Acidoferrales bacterium]
MRARIFFAVILFFGFLSVGMCAQTTATDAVTPQWEVDAGGKMTFDVASVKKDAPDSRVRIPTFPLDNSDTYPGNMTLLSADSLLTTYIGFAYKLPPNERQVLEAQLPKWATTERFAIEARAAAPSTKNQMRLMMQSLLAERFKLAIHFETQEKPVFALVLARSGKTGPQLRRNADDPPCSAIAHIDQVPRELVLTVGYFPPMCGSLMSLRRYENGANLITWGSRNVSTQQIADDIFIAPTANIDRPLIDQTGLSGNFDFVMNFGEPSPVPAGGAEPDDSGPTFLEALRDQLGLRLDSTMAAVENPVLEHVEEPSAN